MAVLLRDIIANGLCVVNVKRSESESESESKFLPQKKSDTMVLTNAFLRGIKKTVVMRFLL